MKVWWYQMAIRMCRNCRCWSGLVGVHWDIYFEESVVLSIITEGHVPHGIAGEERREGALLTDILNTNRTVESFSHSQKLFLEHCSRCNWYPTWILLPGQYIHAPALQRLAATGSHICNLLKRAVHACREPHGGRCLQRWEWHGIWLIDGGVWQFIPFTWAG